MTPPATGPTILHATTVAFGQARGVLITGASGSGKSALALRLMGLGARLVADDRTVVARQGPRLLARSPVAIRGRIEARGVGLLRAVPLPAAQLALAVDLDRIETDRLPLPRELRLLGRALPLLLGIEGDYLPEAIRQTVTAGRVV